MRPLTVSVTVTNTGTRTADEVVQLYLHQRYGTASRPVRELKGFRRVTARGGGVRGPSSSRSAPTSCATGTPQPGTGCIDASTFDVWVGGDSTVELGTSFTVTG